MPYNGSGTFSLYTPGNPVVTGTTISSTWWNNTGPDIATGLSTAITKDGQTTATAGIGFYPGTVSLPGIYLGTDTATGFYRIGANNNGYAVSGTKLLDMNTAVFGVTGKTTSSLAFVTTAAGGGFKSILTTGLLADNDTFDTTVPGSSGIILLRETTSSGEWGLFGFSVDLAATTLIAQSAGNAFSVTQGTNDRINVYINAATVRIENTFAVARTVLFNFLTVGASV